MKKKSEPKPITAVKTDFIASLENLTQQGILLLTALETALHHNAIPKHVAGLLQERTAAFRAALFEPLTLED